MKRVYSSQGSMMVSHLKNILENQGIICLIKNENLMPAPCFAEHNDYVFGELLGISEDELAKLAEAGVMARVPLR